MDACLLRCDDLLHFQPPNTHCMMQCYNTSYRFWLNWDLQKNHTDIEAKPRKFNCIVIVCKATLLTGTGGAQIGVNSPWDMLGFYPQHLLFMHGGSSYPFQVQEGLSAWFCWIPAPSPKSLKSLPSQQLFFCEVPDVDWLTPIRHTDLALTHHVIDRQI